MTSLKKSFNNLYFLYNYTLSNTKEKYDKRY